MHRTKSSKSARAPTRMPRAVMPVGLGGNLQAADRTGQGPSNKKIAQGR